MTAHDHRTFVEGCYRCDLSRDEVERVDLDALIERLGAAAGSPYTQPEHSYAIEAGIQALRQERERAEEASHAAGRHKSDAALYEAALSRAEETIEAVEDFVTRHYLDTQMGQKVLGLITERDKQKGAEHG